MTLVNLYKTPWPWFGGKSDAAPQVWAALGDVAHYVEPFAGSLAVLLRRPHVANRTYYSETVNDADGLLVNAWRSLQLSPDATAEAASWPVSEADLHARHLALLRWRSERQLEHLMGDPLWHDPVMAGWWMWGQSCWIGSGWCSGDGPWTVGDDGRIEKRSARANGSAGVGRQIPHLGDNGQGANRPQLREEGVAYATEYHPMTMPELRRWFAFLSARLRHVRIMNGDWSRACTNGALKTLPVRQGDGVAGVFLDPPYADTAERMGSIYTHDDLQVAHAAREWAIKAGTDPKLRIVFAGFDGEHGAVFTDAGWREIEWYKSGFLKGGMGNVGGTGNTQMTRDRLWLSPHCQAPEADRLQGSLFGGAP
jgi:hypothetical protein